MSWWGSGYQIPRAVAKAIIPRTCRRCACFVGACIPTALVPRILKAAEDGTLDALRVEIADDIEALTRECTRCHSPTERLGTKVRMRADGYPSIVTWLVGLRAPSAKRGAS